MTGARSPHASFQGSSMQSTKPEILASDKTSCRIRSLSSVPALSEPWILKGSNTDGGALRLTTSSNCYLTARVIARACVRPFGLRYLQLRDESKRQRK
ncbi:hypothetical protein E2C01_006166 [Portunus trituberculatus]|uniref:Uncharacterized protein n=1 Tax=Portunus trituberculatus TaxID=210409 RepID=A0A5B7CUJ0_PORTR|nr:hypothetical protein [Portunus trituberculatus]